MDVRFKLFDDDFWENYRKAFNLIPNIKLDIPKMEFDVPEIKFDLPKIEFKIFNSYLFSDEILDILKENTKFDFVSIQKALNLVKYEYIKNSLVRNEPIAVIDWVPKTDNIFFYSKINSANTKQEVTSNNQYFSTFITGIYIGSLQNETQNFITYFSSEVLPFLPESIRPICLLIVLYVIANNKTQYKKD
ncbi:MAG: hypothetical protein L0H27_06870 [Tetragenococcus halophilus]|nr:hypothetical protein [Tetragenococcus halophilus]